jgi:GTP 3',8-cyclase
LVDWAHECGYDVTFIEVMPLGEVSDDRFEQYCPLTELRASLERRFTLTPSLHASGGPARYFEVAETGGRIGFITPLTHNFCESCNRVRVTCIGTLYMCLGQEDAADCVRRCVAPSLMIFSKRRSAPRSCASPRAMIS